MDKRFGQLTKEDTHDERQRKMLNITLIMETQIKTIYISLHTQTMPNFKIWYYTSVPEDVN